MDANASVGVADTIEFAIGTGQQTIAPATFLPAITDQVTIDGTTQPGGATCGTNFASRNLLIEIDGTNIPPTTGPNLDFDTGSDGSIVRGIVSNRADPTGGNSVFKTTNSPSNITFQCNNINTNVAGTASGGTSSVGINISGGGDNNIIGGVNPGEGNIISGGNDGVILFGGADSNIVQGNWIGLGSDGNCIGNGTGQGISMTGSNNLIGGNSAAARNVISCHTTLNLGSAIDMVGGFGTPSTGNKIQGNYLGTDANGQVTPGYGNNSGVPIVGDAQDNLIGGSGSGEGNIIAGNRSGVLNLSFGAFLATNNSILGNKIYDNTGGAISSLGIDNVQTDNFVDFVNAGVTLNDVDDIDYNGTNTGSNHYLNFPVINSITSSNGQVTINYDLDINDAEAGATGYRVEFFANDAADPSGYGEGQTFLGYENVAGDVTGQSVTLALPAGVEGNKFISATTTMTDNSTDGFGHTSEFGALVEGNLVPTAAVTPATATLASTGHSSYLLLLISFLVIASGGVGLYRALRSKNTRT